MKLNSGNYRNMIFGIEDSLVSTVGVLFGVASANQSPKAIIITGLVVIIVEATSMGIGAYLSESATQVRKIFKFKRSNEPFKNAIIMFLSYFLAGFIPLFPYLVFKNHGKIISILLTLTTLYIVGYFPNKKSHDGIKMALLAGLAILFGFIIGNLGNHYL